VETDRGIWRLFAAHYHLFRGTPTRMWFDHTIRDAVRPHRAAVGEANADAQYDQIAERCCSATTIARARCSSASTSRRSRPPKARSTTSDGTR
jgi:glucuronate isomerase